MTRISFSTTDLDTLSSQLTLWRRRQTGRTCLPGELWNSAAALARAQGVGPVARTLRLDYYKLKRFAAAPPVLIPQPLSSATFVEVALTGSPARGEGSGYAAHLHDGTTARMTLQLGADLRAVIALAEAFWNRPR